MFKKFMMALFSCIFAMASVYAAEKATPEGAKKLVQEAAAYMEANGKENALKEFSKRDGKFVRGDMYIFACDLEAVMIAHPVNPGLVGRNLISHVDSKGKPFMKEIVELAKTKGSGFVDYTFLNPVTKQEEPKTTYIKKAIDLIICCGAYK